MSPSVQNGNRMTPHTKPLIPPVLSYTCHQAIILPPFCILSFLLIHEILETISSLKSMTHVTHYISQYLPTATGYQISA